MLPKPEKNIDALPLTISQSKKELSTGVKAGESQLAAQPPMGRIYFWSCGSYWPKRTALKITLATPGLAAGFE